MTRAVIALGLLVLTGCSAPADAPTDPGICWMQAPAAGKGKPALALLSRGDPNLETCAMHLELTRISKRRSSVMGAFQGQYIFVDREAVASSDSLTGQRFALFTPGQRADVDAQIIDLLRAQPKPASVDAPKPVALKAAP